MSKRVEIREDEKSLSYAKYYYEELAPIPKENIEAMKQPCQAELALKIQNRNRLFEEGYLDVETGYCVMCDGTGFVANHLFMPEVTTEMFDWWFAWHGLGALRYTIWDSEDHYEARCINRAQAFNPSLSYREKYWGTTHLIREDIGLGVDDIFVTFRNPKDMGFNSEKIGTSACSTIVTSNGGSPNDGAPLGGLVMCHFVREVEGGIELRTRFWMGWHIVGDKEVKLLPDGVQLPIEVPKALCAHAAKEFTNLARLLPRIFAEEKDNW
ncbi:MAG: hypothetical protein H6Q69_4291 [Firmicutes bacterium]|nr:hypothetical protein [Bacillota bacterium]